MDGNHFSIVHYFSEQEKHKCGYCKQTRSNATYGMWAQCLTVHDYQDLIDRGWRRSGKYCYKPIMDVTCCPMYTIRCEALNLKLSKSQKKILKRVNKFLSDGIKESDSSDKLDSKQDSVPMDIPTTSCTHLEVDESKINTDSILNISDRDMSNSNLKHKLEIATDIGTIPSTKTIESDIMDTPNSSNITVENPDNSSTSEKNTWENLNFKQGEGIDPSKPPCKKAKLMRIERKKEKLAAAGLDLETQLKANKKQQEGKSLEQFLAEIPENAKHKLKISLVRTTPHSEEWLRTSKISHDVYVKYQMAIHGDSREKCSENQFTRFLVESPLQIVLKRMDRAEETFKLSAELFTKYQIAIHNDPVDECDEQSYTEFLVDTPLKALYPQEGPAHGYGSFHQQYWLDEHLIAVGVIDILPKCVSSVYFFYDPDYSNLSLGTYGSLRELHFTRELHKTVPDLEYYYMGYYIHSCPKMRYKANLTPSYLLCPETNCWFPLEQCLPKLNIDAYARFNDDSNATDPNRCSKNDINNIPILYNYNVFKYGRFRLRYGTDSDNELMEYGNLVGKYCASRMILVRD